MRYLNIVFVGFLIQRRRYASDKSQTYHLQIVVLLVEIEELFFLECCMSYVRQPSHLPLLAHTSSRNLYTI